MQYMKDLLHSSTPKALSCLLQFLAHDSAVPDGRNQANQVHQAREAMDPAKLLVKGHHLLGMRWSIIALLPIPGFYTTKSVQEAIFLGIE